LTPKTLLVLGSKPEPVLPPRHAYDALACANASGFSAARHGLPMPAFTAMSAVLTSGIASGRHSLQAVSGLGTGRLYFVPRPPHKLTLARRLLHPVRTYRITARCLRGTLRSVGYRYDEFVELGWHQYYSIFEGLCRDKPEILELLGQKHPSTGVAAVALGLVREGYERVIISGFSFELTHAHGHNPDIDERLTVASKHADTDIAVLRHLHETRGNVYTTEPAVTERAGIPPMPGI
jgi:hypothetical protein